MPKSSCQGLDCIQETRNRQLSTRPVRTSEVAEKKNTAEPERRVQYSSANTGKSSQVSRAPAPTASASTSTTFASGTRLRLCQTKTAPAAARLRTDDREYESTKALKNTAPPASSALRETGDSERGRENATAIITRKNEQKLPSVLAS